MMKRYKCLYGVVALRKRLGWISGIRLFWLLGALFLANILCLAWPVALWPGPLLTRSLAVDGLAAYVAGVLWAVGMTAICEWAVSYLRLAGVVRWTMVSGFLFMTGVFGLGLGDVLLSHAVLAIPWFYASFAATRAVWSLVSIALIIRGVLLTVRELRGVRYERDNLQLVLSFSESVSLMTKQAILDETVSVVRRLTDADACLLFLLDPADDLLKVAASYFDERLYEQEYIRKMIEFPCPRGYGLTGKVLESGEPYLSRDTSRESAAKRWIGDACQPKTTLLLPMKVQGRVIGVLRVTRIGVDQLSASQVTVSSILGNHAAVAMEAGNVYQEVLRASRTDALTGLGNSRAFREELEQMVGGKQSFALLMVDADSLKRVNDTLGHQAGDRLLQELASLMVSAADGIGTSFRYAGDEFLMILPGLHPLEGQAVAERVRADLAAMRMMTPAGPVETTVSIGVAGYPMDGQDAESLMRAADQAMYAAKQAGKNQVCLAC